MKLLVVEDSPLLRKMFGLVLQDVHLFSGTIAGNIRLGDDSIDDGRVREVDVGFPSHEYLTLRIEMDRFAELLDRPAEIAAPKLLERFTENPMVRLNHAVAAALWPS